MGINVKKLVDAQEKYHILRSELREFNDYVKRVKEADTLGMRGDFLDEIYAIIEKEKNRMLKKINDLEV